MSNSSKYSIGFDGKRAFNNRRGLGNYSRLLIDGLVKYYPQNNYTLFTPQISPHIEWQPEGENCQIVTPTSMLDRFFMSRWRRRGLTKLIKAKNLDLYHGLSHELPIDIDKLKVKKIVTVHDLIFLKKPEFYPLVDRVIYKSKFTHSCQVADRVIAICNQTKEDLVECLNVREDKIDVCYQSCDPSFQSLVPEVEKLKIKEKYKLPDNYILFFGALVPNKNVHSVIKAFARARLGVDFSLVIAGRGNLSYKKELMKIAAEMNITKSVYFRDNITDSDRAAIYQMAMLFVFPSFYEGFGIPVLEALASKTPVITSAQGALMEAGGVNTKYIDPYSIDEITSAITSIISSEEIRKKQIDDGYIFSQNFLLENTTKKLVKIYQSLF